MLAAVLLVALSPFDLAATAASRATRSLGRPVTVGRLSVSVGSDVTVDLGGLTVPNVSGGDPRPFLRLDKLAARTTPWSLLGWVLFDRPPVLRQFQASGLRMWLEHGADGRPNWRFGNAAPANAPRTRLPTLLDAHLADGEVDLRTSSGKILATRLDAVAIGAPTAGQPATLSAAGAYNGAPMQLDGALASFDDLHRASTPFSARIRLASGDTVLTFVGTLMRPLGADGADGRLTLEAPSLDRLLVLTGVMGRISWPVNLAAGLTRTGDAWKLSDAAGTLRGQPLKFGLQLQEGPRGVPDAFTLEAATDTLDLGGLPGQGNVGDQTLHIDAEPGTRLDAHVTAKQVLDGSLSGEDVDLTLKLGPGELTIERLAMRFAGGATEIEASVKNAGAGAALRIDGGIKSADIGRLAQTLDLGALPLSGPVDGRASLTGTGTTLAAAGDTAGGGLVLSMQGGTIERDTVVKLSTDLGRMFGPSDGKGQVGCALAVLGLADGIGHIAPLRVRTADGTIRGTGTLDLKHDKIDITVGTERSTTGFFALDVPVHFGGPIRSPHILPAPGNAITGGADLAALPPSLQDMARASPCFAASR